MVGNEIGVLAVGAVVVSPVEYTYGVFLLRQIAEEFTEAALVFLFQLWSGRHIEENLRRNQLSSMGCEVQCAMCNGTLARMMHLPINARRETRARP